MAGLRCPVCEQAAFRVVATLPDVPATIGDCYPTREDALAAPTGTIELAVCEVCGMLRNLAFDESLLAYSPGYENSQMFSGRFRAYAEGLADELVHTYDLAGERVVEIGCGKGEFLELLAQRGVGDAVGYDVSYDGEVDDASGVTIVRDLYGAGPVPDARLLVTRHVVEHLAEPRAVLASLRAAVADRGTDLYVEVPDASFVVVGDGMWDVIYPHVNYFSAPTMRTLLERSGWEPTDVRSVFGEQFLAAHATPSTPTARDRDRDVADVVDAVLAYGKRLEESTQRWLDVLGHRSSTGVVAIWGAGSKGVSFLCHPGISELVHGVVDVNPRKHDTFVPRTGHRVDAPDALAELDPTTVLITNPIYEGEIRAQLDDLGLEPELMVV